VSEVRDSKAYVLFGPLAQAILAGSGEGTIQLDNWRIASSGAAVAAFGNGTADGYALNSSEGFGLRFNDDVFTKFVTSVAMPSDCDPSKPIVFHALGFRTGTLDVTAALTLEAFLVQAGDLFSADADAGGATGAFDAAAANTVQEVTRSITATDVPDAVGPIALTLTMVPTAALDDDDLVILKAWLTYSKR
jgi:hypothetical protein